MASSVEYWTLLDGKFNLKTFYYNIVGLFDPETGMPQDWIDETLAWWNEYANSINIQHTNSF
jgi:hypothetical protein